MRFDTIIIGGGLAGLAAGISLQKAGKTTAIVSAGQNSLHFFSGTFESMLGMPPRVVDLFAEAGIHLHYTPGVRLMSLGTFGKAFLALEDTDLFPTEKFARKALVVNFAGFNDFFSSFLAQGLEKQGIACRVRLIHLPELDPLRQSPSEMRSVHMARILDGIWEKVVQEVRVLIKDEDAVILPQVFGLQGADIPMKIRQAIPARVVFAATMPPSVPGIRTQMMLHRRYEILGGTYLMGDEVVRAHVHDSVVHSVATKNMDQHFLTGDHFILATGRFFAKGLASTPEKVYEPIFGLDVDYSPDRNTWYDADFLKYQPYMRFGVKTDPQLHPMVGGEPLKNLYAVGSILGMTRPDLGSGAGLAINSAFTAVDNIL